MYPKGHASQYRTEFFGFLKLKMGKKLSSERTRINWMKYPTGIDKLFFRCEIDHAGARLCIDIQHKDAGIRKLIFDQFLEMKPVLEKHIGALDWQEEFETEEGNLISRISITHPESNLFDKETWPDAFDFFSKKLIRLDKTWSMAKYTFLQLLH
ncbi:MAG: DUF4268 domain-containing protein [Flavobacteriales bacterium]|nr:DUF4268 domain-containing protein [Flavobacteriales bacterium]